MTIATESPATPPPAPAPKKRIILKVFIVLVVLLIVALIVVYMNINSIVRRTVEKESAASLNVPTKLDAASVSLFGGSVELKGFDIGSPQGFKEQQMMSLGSIAVGVKVSELRQKPIKVSTINLEAPKMVIEMQGTGFNVKKFVDQLPPTDPNAELIKLVIGELSVNGVQVVFKPDVAAVSSIPGIGQSLKGLQQEYVLKIPNLKLMNVGTAEGSQNGAAIKEVVSLLITELSAKAAQSESLPPEVRQLLSLNVNDLKGALKEKLGEEAKKQLGKIGEDLTKDLPPDAAKTVQDILKDPKAASTNPAAAIEQGLGGLLGGKKKPSTQPATRPAR